MIEGLHLSQIARVVGLALGITLAVYYLS